jgi:hypothetical protein
MDNPDEVIVISPGMSPQYPDEQPPGVIIVISPLPSPHTPEEPPPGWPPSPISRNALDNTQAQAPSSSAPGCPFPIALDVIRNPECLIPLEPMTGIPLALPYVPGYQPFPTAQCLNPPAGIPLDSPYVPGIPLASPYVSGYQPLWYSSQPLWYSSDVGGAAGRRERSLSPDEGPALRRRRHHQ